MNKTVKKVFFLIALLVGIFLAWQLVFNKGGILRTGYNALVEGVNGQWHKVAGDNSSILAYWGDNAANNGEGFNIETKGNGGAN